MIVLKYSCPQCRRSMECDESKALDEDVCGHCGCVFLPASRPNVKFCEAENTMPPLPVEVVPPPRRSAKVQKVSAPPRRTSKKVTITAKDIVVARPMKSDRIRQQGSYLTLSIVTMLLYMPFYILVAGNNPGGSENIIFCFIVFCLPTLMISFLAYSKGRRFWHWWMASWFLPGLLLLFLRASPVEGVMFMLFVQLLLIISLLTVEPLSICRSCRMRIPRKSRVCHYCGE